MQSATAAEELKRAYDLGKEAAEAAATWIVDGNTSQGAIKEMLRLIADGDPHFYHCVYPPDLSGEFSDDMTPQKLFTEITGGDTYADDPDGEFTQALCDAWENGVNLHFEQACEAELRKWVSE